MKKGIDYSKELEAAVLGACLIEKTAFSRTYGTLQPEYFYAEDNQKVYRSLNQMYDGNLQIDLITVALWMGKDEQEVLNAGNIGWYLSTLTNHVVSTAHLEYHSLLLKNMWQRRELEKLLMGGAGDKEPKEQMQFINQQLLKIQGSDYKQDWFTMDELMFDLMKHQDDIANGLKEFTTTAFHHADKKNGGYSAGQLIILGARPAVGKSALMAKMALAMAGKGKHVGIISLEMNNTEIAARLSSMGTDIDFSTIYRNLFTDQKQHERFYNIVANQMAHLPIYISDKTKVDLNEIKAKAHKLKNKKGLDVLMLDYLQLVESTGTNKNYNREQEVAKISRGLKLLAMELQIPIIVLCQLSRAVTLRKGAARYPQLSDLRESGSIEQDSDIVAFLHRDWLIEGFQEDHNGQSTERKADLIFAKWRNGAQLHITLDFEPTKMKFSEQGAENYVPVQLIDYSTSKVEQDAF